MGMPRDGEAYASYQFAGADLLPSKKGSLLMFGSWKYYKGYPLEFQYCRRFSFMKLRVVLIVAFGMCAIVEAAEARTLRSTRTNVCSGGFCADVTRIIDEGRNQRGVSIVLKSWPRSEFRNLRCQNGAQWRGVGGTCFPSHTVSVQACTSPVIGRSRCSSWVVFR